MTAPAAVAQRADDLVDAGTRHLQAGRAAPALTAFDDALRQEPRHVTAHANRAIALRFLGRADEAVAACRAAVAIDGSHAEAWSNLGMLLREAGRAEESEQALRRARALRPRDPAIGANLVAVLLQRARFGEALALSGELLREAPASLDAWNARTHALLEDGQFDDAARACEHALAIAPDDATATVNRAIARLSRGDFAGGWTDYEARRRLPNQVVGVRELGAHEWRGEPLSGATVLCTSEQGLGDTLQFVRFAAALKARGARRVIVHAPATLASVIASAPGVDEVASGPSIPNCDLHVPLGSLPGRLGVDATTIPGAPYLRTPDRPVGRLVRAARGLRIGFVWSGNPRQPRNRVRTVPVADLIAALAMPGVSLFSLQRDAEPDRTFAEAVASGSVTDLAPHLADLGDTAAAASACDLVVSVCTSVAHLAGALGRPVITLLSHVADWRWMEGRGDTPWYPSMRLLRQQAHGEWHAPLLALRALAADALARGPASAAPDPNFSPGMPPAPIAHSHATAFHAATTQHLAGRNDAALAAYDALLAAAPAHTGALVNSAVLLAERGALEEAESRLRRATAADPSDAQAWGNLGFVQRQRGDRAGACDAYERAAACEPDRATRWRDVANAASELLRPAVALDAWERALALAPADASLHTDHAAALRAVMRVDDAIAACREALRLDPAHAPAHLRLGALLKEARRWEEAESVYGGALTQFGDDPVVLVDLATLYLEWGRLDEARRVGEHVLATRPSVPDGHLILGCVLLEGGEVDAARAAFERGRAMDPGNTSAAWNLGTLDLLDGELARGLPAFERRRTMPGFLLRTEEVPGREWMGEPLDGQVILVHEEQGLGDTLQFVRYAAELKRRGAARVIVETDAGSASLIATVPGVDAVATRGAALPAYDCFVPMMTLPLRCGTTLQTIPAEVPYFTAPSRPVADIVRAARGRVKVGIVWGGNPRNPRDRFRSVPLPALLAALHGPDVTIVSLQKGPHAAALAPWRDHFGVLDLDAHLATLDDTAAAIGALDVVITVCTSMAHLAGGLGHRTWTLLSEPADWRWFRHRTDSPWYPGMRLFRQPVPGEWAKPLGEVHQALQLFVEERRRGSPREFGGNSG